MKISKQLLQKQYDIKKRILHLNDSIDHSNYLWKVYNSESYSKLLIRNGEVLPKVHIKDKDFSPFQLIKVQRRVEMIASIYKALANVAVKELQITMKFTKLIQDTAAERLFKRLEEDERKFDLETSSLICRAHADEIAKACRDLIVKFKNLIKLQNLKMLLKIEEY